jgi:hypothetical protein
MGTKFFVFGILTGSDLLRLESGEKISSLCQWYPESTFIKSIHFFNIEVNIQLCGLAFN